MAQTRTLQRRIRSVKNAGQITKALEVVAASRMRRTSSFVEASRHYGEVADQIMQRISGSAEARLHPLLAPNTGKTKLYIVFNSDRGQAGAFNTNVFNAVHKAMVADRGQGYQHEIIVFGRKGTHHFARLHDVDMVGAYEDVPDVPPANYFAAALEAGRHGYQEGRFGEVDIFYTEFVSSLTQKVSQRKLLPIEPSPSNADQPITVFELEPDIEAVLDEAARLYVEARIMQARVESAVSEYAMRMIAMGNANRNARELADNLTLEMNTVRQAAITQEIAEITGGAEAMAG